MARHAGEYSQLGSSEIQVPFRPGPKAGQLRQFTPGTNMRLDASKHHWNEQTRN